MGVCVINNDNWQLKAIDRQFLDWTGLDWAADAASVLAFARLLSVLRQARLVCGSCGNHSLFSRFFTGPLLSSPLPFSLSLYLSVWHSAFTHLGFVSDAPIANVFAALSVP